MGKASAFVVAIHGATGAGKATVDVQMFGQIYQYVRYPAWYTPRLNDVVVVEWLGSQPYVSVAFF